MLPVAVVGNVDPQMPPERFSCQCTRELDEKSSLPLQMESWGAEIWRDFARNLPRSLLQKNSSISMTYSGCAERQQRTRLRCLNSLIHGKIQGISVETPLPACTNPLEHETSLDEFPAIGTENFLSLTGNRIAPNSEFGMSVYWREADIPADPNTSPLMTHSGHSSATKQCPGSDGE